MSRAWIYFFVLFWMLYLVGSGMYLFSKGFLLSRRVQTERNQCIRLKTCAVDESSSNCLNEQKIDEILANVNSSSDFCLPPKNRVILLVIDALRYEFGVFNNETDNPLPFENKLPVLNRLMNEQPKHSRLMKFIADAPTTTLQRLKGITTGSLPTFIDIGSNFASPEINEDNIIDQLTQNNKTIVMLGDSTWTELFPRRFMRQYAFPSFDIFDLDSVDRGINKSLLSEVAKEDWSLLIAHYLGVDHCGHKYGPLHPEMSRKLNEMNGVIEEIVASMDDQTTLFVIGDHGMTGTGDHGGATDDEVNALLFAYSKSHEFLSESGNKSMNQIDLVPSLASILGVPIPFSNLGSVNLDIVPNVPIDGLNDAHVRMLHTWMNAKQVRNYFSNYTENNPGTFTEDQLDDLFIKFYILSLRVSTMSSPSAIDNFNSDVKSYLQLVLSQCRTVWVQFDANSMSQGLLFTAVVNLFLYLLVTNLTPQQFVAVFSPANLTFIYVSNILLGAGTYVVHSFFHLDGIDRNVFVYTCIYSIALIAFLLIQNWDLISINWSQQQHFGNVATRLIFGLSIVVFFSNSFIVHEQKILCYLVCGSLAVFLYKTRRQYTRLANLRKLKPELILSSSFAKLAVATVTAIALLRATYSFHRCREEQGNCMIFSLDAGVFQDRKSSHSIANIVDLLPILCLALFVTFSRQFLRKCGNLSGFSAHVLLARYGPTVAAIACSGHFFMTLVRHAKSTKSIQQVHIDAMAWTVYLLFALQIIVITSRPLMLFVLQRAHRTMRFSRFERVVPQIVMKMKQMYEDLPPDDTNEDIPIVYGLATVYSSVFWSSCIVFACVYAILLGPLAANGIFPVILAAVVVLVLNAVLRYQQCSRFDFCLSPEFIAMVAWNLLAHYSFYATGHQATLSQIDWHAAFVGRTAMYDHNNLLSAILVLVNTFGGHFIIFFLFPLLVTTPTSLYTIYPMLVPRRTTKIVIKNQDGTKQREIVKKIVDRVEDSSVTVNSHSGQSLENEDIDSTRGELTLYESEDVFFSNLFRTACNLLILQGIRIFCSMLACTIHCRHLMVWKIFAPRFIYEGIATYIIFGAILIAFLVVIRIHNAVSRLITTMSEAQL